MDSMNQSLPPLSIFRALEASRLELNIEPQRLVIVTETSMPAPAPLTANLVLAQTDHSLPIAIGIATANPALRVFTVTEAKSQYRGAIQPMLEAAAQNQNVKVIVRNPTYFSGGPDPLGLALSCDASFVARGFVGDHQHLQTLISAATRHDGFAIIDVVEPDSHAKSFAWHRQNLQEVSPTKKEVAWQALQSKKDKIAVGILFQKRQPSYQSELLKHIPSPLVDQPLKNINIKPLLKDLK